MTPRPRTVAPAQAGAQRLAPQSAARGYALLRIAVHIACAIPFALLVYDTLTNHLGTDPVAVITHRTGSWALRLLLLTLAVTPLRRVLRRPQLVKLRRPLGLWAFFYASCHFTTYLVLDLGGYWPQILTDVVKRPFITVGFLAWLLLLPLAATSTQKMQRRLGRGWVRLHRLVYLIGALGCLHFAWVVKSGKVIARVEPVVYFVALAVLLAWRVDWRALVAGLAPGRGARPAHE